MSPACRAIGAKMLFSPPARDFLPTRANIVCFRRSSISVFLGDRIVCGWVGGHFSSRVAWVSSPPTHPQTINILGSSEFYVSFQHVNTLFKRDFTFILTYSLFYGMDLVAPGRTFSRQRHGKVAGGSGTACAKRACCIYLLNTNKR